MTESYEKPLNFITFFANFAQNLRIFMPVVLYLVIFRYNIMSDVTASYDMLNGSQKLVFEDIIYFLTTNRKVKQNIKF